MKTIILHQSCNFETETRQVLGDIFQCPPSSFRKLFNDCWGLSNGEFLPKCRLDSGSANFPLHRHHHFKDLPMAHLPSAESNTFKSWAKDCRSEKVWHCSTDRYRRTFARAYSHTPLAHFNLSGLGQFNYKCRSIQEKNLIWKNCLWIRSILFSKDIWHSTYTQRNLCQTAA